MSPRSGERTRPAVSWSVIKIDAAYDVTLGKLAGCPHDGSKNQLWMFISLLIQEISQILLEEDLLLLKAYFNINRFI